jgi:hypothetical protein
MAGKMDLNTAAAEFRKADEGLTWLAPMDTEQSYQQVIGWVHVELEGELNPDKQNLLVTLDREDVRLFGHSPDLQVPVGRDGSRTHRAGRAARTTQPGQYRGCSRSAFGPGD